MTDEKRPIEPEVVLDVWTIFCPRHLEPFKEAWPKGFPLAMVWFFQYATTMPAIWDKAKGDSEKLNSAIDEFKPLCCFVPDNVREAITLRALDK